MALTIPGALADQVSTDDALSAAHGHGIFVEGLGLDIASSATTFTSYPDKPGPDNGDLDLTALGEAEIIVHDGLEIPLIAEGEEGGLLTLGSLGALKSYSHSPHQARSVASSGLLGDDGSLDLGASSSPDFAPAQLNLTALLGEVLDSDQLLDEATIQVGALGSTAENEAGVVDDAYMLSDLRLELGSPLLEGLAGTVSTELENVLDPLQDSVNPGGEIRSLVDDVVATIDGLGLGLLVNAELNELSVDTGPLLATVQTELLESPLSDAEGSVLVDLDGGTISVNLAELLIDSENAVDLNSLPANTDALDPDVLNAILAGVTEALVGPGENSLISKATSAITGGLYGIELDLSIQADVLGVVDAPVLVSGSLGGFLGVDGYDTEVDVTGINIAGVPVGTVVDPIIDELNDLVDAIGGELDSVLTPIADGVQPSLVSAIEPLVDELLDDAVRPLLTQVATITINEQPEVGDLGDENFTVRALAVTLLPALDGAVRLELGSSSVIALDEYSPTLAATTPIEPGDDTTVTSGGWPSETTVILQLQDEAGNDVGPAVEADTDLDGDIEAENLRIPVDAEHGDIYRVVATDVAGNTAVSNDIVVWAQDGNVNASASAAASADADGDNNAVAQAAAQAAADADANSTASAAADADATAAAEAAAVADASTAASADATTDANASAAAAATASADADVDSAQDADATAAANANASAAAAAAAEADASVDASAAAAADSDVNASASAAASANADDNSNASAQAAAQAAADADANTTASAAADADATAAAASAATADASAEASANVDADVTAAATAAAQASAAADADASAAANANASTAAQAAAAADASTNASQDAAADASAAASGDSSAATPAAADSSASVDAQGNDAGLASTGGNAPMWTLAIVALIVVTGAGLVMANRIRNRNSATLED